MIILQIKSYLACFLAIYSVHRLTAEIIYSTILLTHEFSFGSLWFSFIYFLILFLSLDISHFVNLVNSINSERLALFFTQEELNIMFNCYGLILIIDFMLLRK